MKRGGATNRQDRDDLFRPCGAFQFIEPSEDLRLELCRTFDFLIRGIMMKHAERTIDAYYPEIIFSLTTATRDPFPEVKIESCHLLVQLLRIPHFEHGAILPLGLLDPHYRIAAIYEHQRDHCSN